MRYLTPEQKQFYLRLEESLEQFPGFTKLPDPTHWDRYKPLFHMARAKHVHDPEAEDNWICMVNNQAEYVMALPREICPEGITTIDQVKRKMDKQLQRIKKKARAAAAEYGEFEVRKIQGRIFLRHVGAIPI